MMASDKFDYHSGARDFPRGVPRKNGGTHIGMFLDWARARGLLNEDLHSPIGSWLFRHGVISGRTFASAFGDRSFQSGDDLNDTGDAFANAYYDEYLQDYDSLFADQYETIYHVAYSRQNCKRVADLLDQRYATWRASVGKSPAP